MIILHSIHKISLFIIWNTHWTLERNKMGRKGIDKEASFSSISMVRDARDLNQCGSRLLGTLPWNNSLT